MPWAPTLKVVSLYIIDILFTAFASVLQAGRGSPGGYLLNTTPGLAAAEALGKGQLWDRRVSLLKNKSCWTNLIAFRISLWNEGLSKHGHAGIWGIQCIIQWNTLEMRLGQPVMVGLRYEWERAHGALGVLKRKSLLQPCQEMAFCYNGCACELRAGVTGSRHLCVCRGEVLTPMEFQQTCPSSCAFPPAPVPPAILLYRN